MNIYEFAFFLAAIGACLCARTLASPAAITVHGFASAELNDGPTFGNVNPNAAASYMLIYAASGPLEPPQNRSRFLGVLAAFGEQVQVTMTRNFSKQGYFATANPVDACSALLTNATENRNVTNSVALVPLTSTCSFVFQAKRMQDAGAVAVLVRLIQ